VGIATVSAGCTPRACNGLTAAGRAIATSKPLKTANRIKERTDRGSERKSITSFYLPTGRTTIPQALVPPNGGQAVAMKQKHFPFFAPISVRSAPLKLFQSLMKNVRIFYKLFIFLRSIKCSIFSSIRNGKFLCLNYHSFRGDRPRTTDFYPRDRLLNEQFPTDL
jgi:hypothetical protein